MESERIYNAVTGAKSHLSIDFKMRISVGVQVPTKVGMMILLLTIPKKNWLNWLNSLRYLILYPFPIIRIPKKISKKKQPINLNNFFNQQQSNLVDENHDDFQKQYSTPRKSIRITDDDTKIDENDVNSDDMKQDCNDTNL
eukprot:UN32481